MATKRTGARSGPRTALRSGIRGRRTTRERDSQRRRRATPPGGPLATRRCSRRTCANRGAEAWFEDLFTDIRHTARYLRKSPGFTATAVVSLGLGIGANTAIFTIIDAVLLKSLPVRDPSNLVVLGEARGSGSGSGIPRDGSFSLYSYDLYKHLQATNVFGELCAVQSTTQTGVSVRRSGWSESQLAQARLVSGNYFEVLGVNAAMGRAIVPSDDSPSATPVAVVSFRYWKDRLGGDPSIIGSNINVGGVSFTIIGVTPPQFYGETLGPDPPGLWLPLSADRLLNRERALIDSPGEHWLYLIGRLAPNVSAEQAQIRLTATLRSWLLTREGSAISAEQPRTNFDKPHQNHSRRQRHRAYATGLFADPAFVAGHLDSGFADHMCEYRQPSAC